MSLEDNKTSEYEIVIDKYKEAVENDDNIKNYKLVVEENNLQELLDVINETKTTDYNIIISQ